MSKEKERRKKGTQNLSALHVEQNRILMATRKKGTKDNVLNERTYLKCEIVCGKIIQALSMTSVSFLLVNG